MVTESSIANSKTAILARVIDPATANLAPQAAQSILALDFRETDKDRMNQLAAKAREGRLAKEEEQELDSYLLVGHLLDLLHSKARVSLGHHSSLH